MSFTRTLPQTSFNLYPQSAILGQLYKTAATTENIRSLPAVALVKAGDLLEKVYDATTLSYSVRAAQSANGALATLAGVAIYKSAKGGGPAGWAGQSTPSDYQIGELVSFCRRGSIFAKWLSKDGTTGQVSYSAPNYAHSTTAGTAGGSASGTTKATTNGAFTDFATSAVAGSEVDACPTGVQLGEDQTGVTPNGSGLQQSPGFGVCLVELNLP